MPTVGFPEARHIVLETVQAAFRAPAIERVPIEDAGQRVLAEDIAADRDYPALARSVRDGFAVRARDIPGELDVIGEVRAGQRFEGRLGPRQAIEIMTGAPIPEGADAVVMVEHVQRDGGRIRVSRTASTGDFINPQGCEARTGEPLLRAGKRLDYTDIAMLAATGKSEVPVFAKTKAAILPTGDEIVGINETPLEFQVRNSNSYALAEQVRRAGGIPEILAVARDDYEHTRGLIDRGLASDLLLLSGGVSAGKYDIVERVLADFGAEFFFDRVLIQPGQPLVFGRAMGKFFFGLPGNPSSTMVTFELFARAALELLSGQRASILHMPYARLTRDFRHKTGLTRFLPACLSADGGEVTPVAWHGSGDMPALTRANAFLVADSERAEWRQGDLIRVLPK